MSDPVSRVRSLAAALGFDLVEKGRHKGPSKKWNDARYCDLWVYIHYQMWVRKTTKLRPMIEAIIRERLAKGRRNNPQPWPPIDIRRWSDMGEPEEVRITERNDPRRKDDPQVQDAKTVRRITDTVRRAYKRANDLLEDNPHLRKQCLDDLEIAKRWHGVKITVRKKPDSGGLAT